VRGGRDGVVERIEERVVEGKHARRESIQGRSSMAWTSCSPRESPLAGAGRVARKLRGVSIRVSPDGGGGRGALLVVELGL